MTPTPTTTLPSPRSRGRLTATATPVTMVAYTTSVLLLLVVGGMTKGVQSQLTTGVDSSSSGFISRAATPATTFKAAVYEHVPFMAGFGQTKTRAEAVTLMKRNLAVYQTQMTTAKSQGVQIIVFPEYGIYGLSFDRKSIYPFLEQIPDPEVTSWSPCSDPTRFPDTEVQHALSCMAQDHAMYVVADMGDRVACDVSTDPKCPNDGHYQYNTAVAYGPDGTLVARYHKRNLFFEVAFDYPESKVVYFDTPFGRVGLLICFDLLFKEPAVSMVTEYNVTTVAFPTAWFDGLPLLSAMGFHSSFARGMGVNLLAANVHLPLYKYHGSGIFTPKGAASFYYDSDRSSPGRLLVSTIDVPTPSNHNPTVGMIPSPTPTTSSHLSPTNEFKSQLFHDEYTFRLVMGSSGTVDVCQGGVCCSLTYEYADDATDDYWRSDLYAVGVFDGLHTYHGQYYLQTCALVKCATSYDKYSCGTSTASATTKFKSFSLSGKFSTPYVYPQVILYDGSQLALTDEKAWSFHGNTIAASGPGLDKALLSASLIGRDYTRDGNTRA